MKPEEKLGCVNVNAVNGSDNTEQLNDLPTDRYATVAFAEKTVITASDTQAKEKRQLASAPISSGASRWVTPELIADTIATWQPYYDDPLTVEDAVQILLSVAQLVDVLE